MRSLWPLEVSGRHPCTRPNTRDTVLPRSSAEWSLQDASRGCRHRVLGAGYGSEMATVLITQRLQRDFVDPIGPHDPLPNLLHVGYSEATRLLGPEPAAGPLAQLIQWARGLPSDAIDLVHIRDWHDAADPAQCEHLMRFGPHCIKGTAR